MAVERTRNSALRHIEPLFDRNPYDPAGTSLERFPPPPTEWASPLITRPLIEVVSSLINAWTEGSPTQRSSSDSRFFQPHGEHQDRGKDEGQSQAAPQAVDAKAGLEAEYISNW